MKIFKHLSLSKYFDDMKPKLKISLPVSLFTEQTSLDHAGQTAIFWMPAIKLNILYRHVLKIQGLFVQMVLVLKHKKDNIEI